VTLGGAIANDVHGKNHHVSGTIGCSVRNLQLLRSDRQLLKLAPEQKHSLFSATIGGLGLTGIICAAELELTRIGSAYLDVEYVPFGHVRDFFALAAESETAYEHTVAWVDCASGKAHLGRGIFQRANWCEDGELTSHNDRTVLAMPMDAPGFALNGLTVRLFNAVYYRAQQFGSSRQHMHYAPFFYPLDTIRQWNRLYGKRGFYQYQCVLPTDDAPIVIEELLKQIARAGAGSFLSVLKTFGSIKSPGLLSFPRQGATLALDFPNKGKKTLSLLGLLDDLVKEAGGRLYPAKDGRMPREMLETGYPMLEEFQQYIDPSLSSDFWRRVSA
jgi:L-gulonolactone oxidase